MVWASGVVERRESVADRRTRASRSTRTPPTRGACAAAPATRGRSGRHPPSKPPCWMPRTGSRRGSSPRSRTPSSSAGASSTGSAGSVPTRRRRSGCARRSCCGSRSSCASGLVRARLYATARGVYSAFVNGERADDQVLAPGLGRYEHRISVQCVRRDRCARRGRERARHRARRRVVGRTPRPHRLERAVRHAHLGDLAAAPRLRRRHDRGGGVRCRCCAARSVPWAYADLFVGEQFDRRAVPRRLGPRGIRRRRMDAGHRGRSRPRRAAPVHRRADPSGAGAAGASRSSQTAGGRGRRLRSGARRARAAAAARHGARSAGRHRAHRDARRRRLLVREHRRHQQGADRRLRRRRRRRRVGARVHIPRLPVRPDQRVVGARSSADDIVAVVLASDLEQTGSFAASDAPSDRLHQNVVWSQRGNFLSVPDRLPAARARRAGPATSRRSWERRANNAQVVPFLSRWLDNLRADQLPDGRIPIFSPRSPFDAEAAANAQGIGSIVAAAGWSDAIAIVPVDAVRAVR